MFERYYVRTSAGQTIAELNPNATGRGTVTAVNDFYPFGKILRTGGPATIEQNKFKFSGKERDQESGLDYFGARYEELNKIIFTQPTEDKQQGKEE